jgi:hypothetical protein
VANTKKSQGYRKNKTNIPARPYHLEDSDKKQRPIKTTRETKNKDTMFSIFLLGSKDLDRVGIGSVLKLYLKKKLKS